MLAPSNTFCTRLQSVARVRTKLARWRARVAQVADRHGWDKTGTQQSVLQQLGQPLRIFDIGLTARHMLDMRRVDQQDFDYSFEDIEDRLPVFACALYRHVRTALRDQPISQDEQLTGHGGKGARLLLPASFRGWAQEARDDRPFMDIQTCTVCINDFHRRPHEGKLQQAWMPLGSESDMRATHVEWVRQLVVPVGIRVRLTYGFCGHQCASDLRCLSGGREYIHFHRWW